MIHSKHIGSNSEFVNNIGFSNPNSRDVSCTGYRDESCYGYKVAENYCLGLKETQCGIGYDDCTGHGSHPICFHNRNGGDFRIEILKGE